MSIDAESDVRSAEERSPSANCLLPRVGPAALILRVFLWRLILTVETGEDDAEIADRFRELVVRHSGLPASWIDTTDIERLVISVEKAYMAMPSNEGHESQSKIDRLVDEVRKSTAIATADIALLRLGMLAVLFPDFAQALKMVGDIDGKHQIDLFSALCDLPKEVMAEPVSVRIHSQADKYLGCLLTPLHLVRMPAQVKKRLIAGDPGLKDWLTKSLRRSLGRGC